MPVQGCSSVYNFTMALGDSLVRIRPWLKRWSIEDLAHTDAWLGHMFIKSYAAEDFLVHSGDLSDTLYLLESGLVRLYYTTPDGKERNKAFYRAGQITGPVSAAITSSPAPFTIQALEPTEAICFRFRDLLRATQHNADLAGLYREMLAEAFIRNEQREAVLLTCNAEQRYTWLQQHEPDLLERVAQFHVASYLGVDAVSLSRLKRKLRQ
jgi:CRP-like cAMP-binding protein